MRTPRIGVVVSRFNEEVTSRLLAGCLKTLKSKGVSGKNVAVVEVPGGWEIPWAAQELALSGKFDVIVCLGAVLKGRTAQNGYIAQAVYARLQSISLDTRVPCILGVIVPATYAQAMARVKGKLDRGRESALAALEMAKLKMTGHAGPRRGRAR